MLGGKREVEARVDRLLSREEIRVHMHRVLGMPLRNSNVWVMVPPFSGLDELEGDRKGIEMSGTKPIFTRNLGRLLGSFAVVSSFLVQGCATAGGDNPFTESQAVDGYLIRVESRNSFEVMVYVNPYGRRELVGSVPGNGLEFLEFAYPQGLPLNIELETRLGDRYRMQPFRVPGGGRLDLVIMSDLRRSGFVRREPRL